MGNHRSLELNDVGEFNGEYHTPSILSTGKYPCTINPDVVNVHSENAIRLPLIGKKCANFPIAIVYSGTNGNVNCCSRDIVYNMVKQIPPSVLAYARKGEKFYDDNFGMYVSRMYDELEANDIWVGDNHTFDFFTQGEHGRLRRLYVIVN